MVRCLSCELDFDQCLKFVYNYDDNTTGHALTVLFVLTKTMTQSLLVKKTQPAHM